MNRKALGNSGEDDAAELLEARGYRLIARNVRPLPGMSRGEIDIIAWDADILCFIEVKTRLSIRNQAAENVTPAKQRQIINLAEVWLSLNEPAFGDAQVRFDVVCVYAAGREFETARLEIMRDAFRPE